jgi:hypothetical protein
MILGWSWSHRHRSFSRGARVDDPEILLKGIVKDLRDFAGGCQEDDGQALLLVSAK